MLAIELNLSEVTNKFNAFKGVIGESFWLRRVMLIDEQIRGFPHLNDLLVKENHIAYALARCSDLIKRYGIIPRRYRRDRSLYLAFSFTTQVLSYLECASSTQRPAFIRRVQNSFNQPDELRGLLFEFIVATHLIRRGHKISLPEVGEAGTPDLLVEEVGINGLEIECKSISDNKGKKIHGREAMEFLKLIQGNLLPYLKNSNFTGGLAVVLSIPSRLPKLLSERQEIMQRVMDSISRTSSESYPDGYEVNVSNFDKSLLQDVHFNTDSKELRQLLDEITYTSNREVMIVGSRKAVVVLALQSKQKDTVLEYLFESLSKSASKQPSKKRAALYMVEFTGVNEVELTSIAHQDSDKEQAPSGLKVAVSKFLSSKNRDYVVGVGFLSNGEIAQESDGNQMHSGGAYFFANRTSKFWHKDFEGLFRQS